MENDNENMRQTAGTAIFMGTWFVHVVTPHHRYLVLTGCAPLAPEMLTGESFQGKPIDIWACGITLYMFVYGHPPFIAQTMTVLYGKIQVRNNSHRNKASTCD